MEIVGTLPTTTELIDSYYYTSTTPPKNAAMSTTINELDDMNNDLINEPWESFVDFLEDDCRDFLLDENDVPVTNQPEIDQNVAFLTNNMDTVLRDQVVVNTRETARTGNAKDHDEDRAGAESSDPVITPLRLWINQALNSIGSREGKPAALSSAYINSVIKIAKSLAEQMADSENAIMQQSGEVDLARHVRVHLRGNGQKTTYDDGTLENIASKEIQKAQDMKNQLQSILSSTQTEAITHTKNKNEHNPLQHTFSIASVHGDSENSARSQKTDIDITATSPFEPIQKPFNAAVLRIHNNGDQASPSDTGNRSHPDYLGIETAQIVQPAALEPSCCFDSDDLIIKERQRLFCLGLVFYELFSGGQIPPSNIHALASCMGAFTSLSTLTLVKKKKIEDQNSEENDSNKRHHASSSPSDEENTYSLCQISCDYLKLIGVNSTISSLILNMLECVYGEYSGDHCYHRMLGVAHDLHLIENKPHKFLQDLNTNKLTLTGLPWDEIEINRAKELDAIKSCYRRCDSGSWEAVIVNGESGSGKSWLARHVGMFVAEEGGFFLSAKFDQMRQSKPLSAISSVFDQYCEVLIRERKSADWANTAINRLQLTLGQHAGALIQVVPKLGLLFNTRGSPCDIETYFNTNEKNCTNAAQRMHHLIYKFLEVMSTESYGPVTIFFDDIQWADEASISVMKLVLKFKNLLFLGCFRDDCVDSVRSLGTMFDSASALGVNVVQIKLEGMSADVLNRVLSDLLCLLPRLVKSLSAIVFQRTQGNILFFHQLMLSMYRNRVLYLDFKNHRWHWDQDKLLYMKLPDSIAKCFIDGICKLPPEVQSALHTLAMFGASVKRYIIELLESKLKIKILMPLQRAVAEGLVIDNQGSFTFCHDRIQEASYDLVGEQNRCHNHVTYGKCLVKTALDTDNKDILFLAVNQINLGFSSSVQIIEDKFTMAHYNMLAGKKAISMSDFTLAYNFFESAVGFLQDTHWTRNYDFCLQIYELASKSALAIGHVQSLPVLSSKVIEKAKTFDDTLSIQLINMTVLAYSSKVTDAVEIGRSVLAKLGEQIPTSPQDTLRQEIQKVQVMIEGLSEDQLVNLPMMTDTTKQMAMLFLAKLQSISYFLDPTLHTIVIIKMIQMTLIHGLSSASPLAFTAFGSYLGWIGSIKVGQSDSVLNH